MGLARRGVRRLSYSVDVNLLIYASDGDSPEHGRCREFFEKAALRLESLVLGWSTVYSYLRLATSPSVARSPLSPDRARSNIDKLLAWPQVRVVEHDAESWRIYRELSSRLPLRGNLVPDAQLAALLIRHGVWRLYTRDRDFRKFEGLEVVDPLA